MLCEYGCGQKANYFLKRAKKWCCSKSYNSCPSARNKNRESHIGENNHRYGKVCSEETKNKISQSNKGNIPWNKNKTDVYSDETLQLMSNVRQGFEPWNKGVKNCFSKDTIDKMSESHKGQTPWNKGRLLYLEEKKKISKSCKGKKQSVEFKQKISDRMRLSKNINWKGGYHTSGLPSYDVYYTKLTIEEQPERDLLDKNILTVICSNCKKRFIPFLAQVTERVRCLNGTQNGECRLYCSDECKDICSVFNRSINQKNQTNEIYTQEEYQTFRTNVLERDDYKCQYCGKKAEHVHHERPQKLEPFFALDPDLAWSVCKKCHYKYGHKDECSTG